METPKLVVIHNDVPIVGTFLIAKGLERNHKNLIKTIERCKEDFEDFGDLKSLKSKSTGGRPAQEYLLNEQQTTLLITFLRNLKTDDKVKTFKKKLVKEFFRMRQILDNVKAQHKDINWIETRQEGKEVRLIATDAMKGFESYAYGQGSEHANKYYMDITKMMNATLFIIEGKFKNLRELMTSKQLIIIAGAEYVIDKALKDGMKDKMFYKDIYKLVKERVQTFADLHGQSEIIAKQLALF